MEPIAGYLLRLLVELAVIVLVVEAVATVFGAVRRAIRRHGHGSGAAHPSPTPHAA